MSRLLYPHILDLSHCVCHALSYSETPRPVGLGFTRSVPIRYDERVRVCRREWGARFFLISTAHRVRCRAGTRSAPRTKSGSRMCPLRSSRGRKWRWKMAAWKGGDVASRTGIAASRPPGDGRCMTQRRIGTAHSGAASDEDGLRLHRAAIFPPPPGFPSFHPRWQDQLRRQCFHVAQ